MSATISEGRNRLWATSRQAGAGRTIVRSVLSDLSREELQARADELPWFHKIDLGGGVVTKGQAAFTWRPDQLPDVSGRSVLDIGAWDGGYSFMAEKGGASRVVALDHYAWGVRFEARQQYWRECAEAGVLPDHDRDTTDFWDPDLPGKRGFDFAHEALQSRVEPLMADFTTMDLERLGEFDVVLYLGVLYHMKDPLGSLERVRRVVKRVAAIETVALNIPDRNEERLLTFLPGDELGSDFGNWFVPTTAALIGLCQAAGFDRVEVVEGPPQSPQPEVVNAPLPHRLKQALRAAPAAPGGPPAFGYFRALVHAYV